ncbi:MAG: TetR/AcrR family transcriptional regulator [Acidimicrobiia bacterium]
MTAAPAAPPARELSPRAAEIVAVARRVLEAEGADALTMRRVGDELGMKAPSLYKHFPNKAAIELILIEQGLTEMGAALYEAIGRRAPANAVRPLLETYRAVARAHPNLYRLTTVGPLRRADLVPGLEDWAGAPFFLVTGDPYRAQALWSAAHGMVILELDGRYPPGSDLDRTWREAAEVFAAERSPRSAPAVMAASNPFSARSTSWVNWSWVRFPAAKTRTTDFPLRKVTVETEKSDPSVKYAPVRASPTSPASTRL